MKNYILPTLVVSLIPLLVNAAEGESFKNSKPNIILVMTDDQGLGDLSYTGNKVLQTPHIDAFAENAARFTDFQVSPTCAPTRAAIMSGVAPFKVGVTHTILQRERMALSVFTMPEALKSVGYHTGLFGKWHLGDEHEYLPQSRGFDEVLMHGAGGIGQKSLGDFHENSNTPYFDNVLLHNDTVVKTKGFCTDLFFEAAKSWIHKKHQTGEPYFAYISLNAPHGPFRSRKEDAKRFLDLGYDKDSAARYGMIENIDDNFGALMAHLEKWGALENTIVIFMTDNGGTKLGGTLNGKKVKHFNANMRGGKNSPYEGGTHVPFFVQWKGKINGGFDVPALTAHLDMFPTFVEVAGVELPETVQPLEGRSLIPLLKDAHAAWDERNLFFHCGRWSNGKRAESKYLNCAIRTDEWRLSNNSELYNIKNDPSETKEVSAQHPEVMSTLRAAYDAWWESTLDLMVNEGLERVASEDQPLPLLYNKQLKEKGEIPLWEPEAYPTLSK